MTSCTIQDSDSTPSTSASANSQFPQAALNYQSATNSKNIDSYMAIFTDNIEMIDVSRTFNGKTDVRNWAIREVIPYGDTFKLLKIVEQNDGYAKTEVKWISWQVHYSFWWDANNKITKMSLQYKP